MESSPVKDTDAVNLIRQIESGISQDILIARRQAIKNISDAQSEANNLAVSAVQRGQQNGNITSQIIIKEAEKKVQFLIEKAREEAVRFSNPSEDILDSLIQQAVDFICGR